MGDVSPGGRLPISFPRADEKRFTSAQYPGECPPPVSWCPEMTANFSEGTLVGYRWNDAKQVPAAFSFGHGLDYTTYQLQDFKTECKLDRPLVSFEVANTGGRNGTAVPQLYIGFPSLSPTIRQLRGFQKVWVPVGGSSKVAFHLDVPDWSFYNEKTARWESAMDRDETITVSVGNSAADLVWYGDLPDCTSASVLMPTRTVLSSESLVQDWSGTASSEVQIETN
mmetsp:Transcript_72516/g.235563  ORF Transcript_72516/g.235563 Transcript_72516/m.235563 type:complete len:225 (-) Transcript_72516:124-798(-)